MRSRAAATGISRSRLPWITSVGACQPHVGFDGRALDARRVCADQFQRALHERFWSKLTKPPVEERLRQPGHRQRRDRSEHHRLGPPDVDGWDRRIDEDERIDPGRMGGGLEDRDMATHRVAHQAYGMAQDLLDEVVDQRCVGAHSGRASEERCLAEPSKIDRDGVMRPRNFGRHRHPVEGAAGEAVDHEERRAGAAEVYVVNGSFDVCDFMPQCVMNRTPGFLRPGG